METDIEKYEPQLPENFREKYAEAGKDTIHEEIRPIIHLVQPQSPEATKGGATPGDMALRPAALDVNYGNKLICTVIASHKEWVMWGARGEGIKARGTKELIEDKFPGSTEWGTDDSGKRVPPKASESRNFALLEYDLGENKVDPLQRGPVLCFMASTSAGTGKSLNTMLRQVDGPIFRMIAEITTAQEENDKGAYYVYKVRSLGTIDWDLAQNMQMLAAYYEAFRKMNASGEVKTAEAVSE